MPSAGKGPKPNIRIGSSTAFKKPLAAISMLGVLVSPQALKILLPLKSATIRILPGSQMTMYWRISTKMDSLAPMSRKIGSRNIQNTRTMIEAHRIAR